MTMTTTTNMNAQTHAHIETTKTVLKPLIKCNDATVVELFHVWCSILTHFLHRSNSKVESQRTSGRVREDRGRLMHELTRFRCENAPLCARSPYRLLYKFFSALSWDSNVVFFYCDRNSLKYALSLSLIRTLPCLLARSILALFIVYICIFIK